MVEVLEVLELVLEQVEVVCFFVDVDDLDVVLLLEEDEVLVELVDELVDELEVEVEVELELELELDVRLDL